MFSHVQRAHIQRLFKVTKSHKRLMAFYFASRLLRIFGVKIVKDVTRELLDEKKGHIADGMSLGWAQGKRRYFLKWLGLTIWTIEFSEQESNILNFFLLRDPSVFGRIVHELKSKGLLLEVGHDPVIFEPGCNMGRMIFYMKDLLRAKVVGCDIYSPSVDFANQVKDEGDEFYSCDLVNSDFLRERADDSFDLAVVSSHLVHIQHFENFNKYLDQLRRVSKRMLIHEKYNEELLATLKKYGPEYLESDQKQIICYM